MMATQCSTAGFMIPIGSVAPGELDPLDQPQVLLEEPEPGTPRSQQVTRLREHHLQTVADAVAACGRLGEKWTYECGREFLRKIIRSNRRFCCVHCDKHIAARLFKGHQPYRERLHFEGTLYQVTIRSSQYPLSSDGIRDFEGAVVAAVRELLKDCDGCGFKSYTHYDSGSLIAKGIIYLPPGISVSFDGLSIPLGTCTVSKGVGVYAYEEMLADMLKPVLTEGRGVLRGDLMAAFHGGRHLRSLGVFCGLVSQRREELRLEEGRGKLDLSTNAPVSGPTFGAYVPPCPHCGRRCRRVSVSREPISELQDVPHLDENDSTHEIWAYMRGPLRRKSVF